MGYVQSVAKIKTIYICTKYFHQNLTILATFVPFCYLIG